MSPHPRGVKTHRGCVICWLAMATGTEFVAEAIRIDLLMIPGNVFS